MRRSRRALLLGILGLLFICLLPGVLAAEPAVPIGPGATYQDLYRPEGPWAIHVVEADLSQEYLELRSLLGGSDRMARRTLSGMIAMARSDISRPIAAVNGDFFSLASGDYPTPLGLHVEDGELVTFPDPSRSVFYLLSDGTAHIDRLRANAWLRGPENLLLRLSGLNRPPGYADLVLFTPRFGAQTRSEGPATHLALAGLTNRVRPNGELSARIAGITTGQAEPIPPDGVMLAARGVAAYALRKLKVGDELTLSLQIEPEKGQIEEALSGGPRLVRDGAISVEHLRERFAESFAARRHPRTGLGIRDGTIAMVVVDGRQPGYSEGMTLHELAKLLVELGCQEALNLDGGGSTTMVVRDRVANSPSGGAERAVVNGLALVSVAPVGPPVQLAIEPREVSVLAGERVALRPTGLDQYYNPVEIRAEEAKWEVTSVLGAVSEGGVFTAASVSRPTMGLVMARLGNMMASSVIRVMPRPARVVVMPDRVMLARGAAQQFSAQAYDGDGEPLAASPGKLSWRVEPVEAGASVTQSGLLRAPAKDVEVAVLACVGGVCGQAEVIVGEELAVVENCERPRQWTYRGEPAEAAGGVEWKADPVRTGNHCLALRYDFSKGAGTRTAHVELNLPLPETQALSVRVLGDGGGGWLRARLEDGAGRVFAVELASKVNWSGSWRRLTVPLPDDVVAPVTLESIYLAEYHEDKRPAGAICLDDIAVARMPPAAVTNENPKGN